MSLPDRFVEDSISSCTSQLAGEEMEGGSHSGGVVKNRSSSGCLIIKKKADGVGAGTSSGERKLHEPKQEKKRPRQVTSGDSVSSDEELLEFY